MFIGVAFRDVRGWRSDGGYFSRETVDSWGAPIADTAYMGLTS
ncbi:hypothetical protein ACIPY3_18295 [Paenarthrobacter sp. NPDC089714]